MIDTVDLALKRLSAFPKLLHEAFLFALPQIAVVNIDLAINFAGSMGRFQQPASSYSFGSQLVKRVPE